MQLLFCCATSTIWIIAKETGPTRKAGDTASRYNRYLIYRMAQSRINIRIYLIWVVHTIRARQRSSDRALEV